MSRLRYIPRVCQPTNCVSFGFFNTYKLPEHRRGTSPGLVDCEVNRPSDSYIAPAQPLPEPLKRLQRLLPKLLRQALQSIIVIVNDRSVQFQQIQRSISEIVVCKRVTEQ
jgi:hypothetical protein